MSRTVVSGVTEVLFPRALVHAYVVQADVPTLIDTGTPGDEQRLYDALRTVALDPRDVGRIILTHRHPDHAGNAATLAGLSSAEVHVSPLDAPYVREGREQPLPVPATPLGRGMVPYVKRALPWAVDAVAVDETLVAGATVGPFAVLETPGHTPGHVSLLWQERGILFTGDAAANITRVGPHPAADDPETARRSFAALRDVDFDTACFGHGSAIASGARTKFADAG